MALLGNLTGSAQYFSDELFYNGVVTTSLRLDKASTGYLYRTPSSASNRRTFTIAFWYKTSIVFASEGNDQNNPIFYADEDGGGGMFQLNVSGQGQGAASDTVNELQYYDYDSADSTDYGLETNSSFSDPSAWYHIVMAFDTTQGTEANRVKVYINGVQRAYTDMNQHHAAVIQNRELNINDAVPHWIGRNIDTTSRYMNGYLADFNFIDGTQYAASDFGEFKNGIWIPKEPNVTYGTNGFRLQFKNTSVGSGSSSTIGADTSGNDNHFTSSGIAANDCAIPDCPENNFCTISPITFPLANKGTIAEGALKIDSTDHQVHTSTFSIPASGKWYWEVNNVGTSGNFIVQYMGVMSSEIFHAEQDYAQSTGSVGEYIRNLAGVSYIAGNDIYYKNFTATSTSNGANESGGFSEANGQGILGVAIDVDAGTIKYYWNNSLVRTDSTLTANIEYFTSTNLTNSGGNIWSSATYNFGQDSSFAGAKTAQGNTDANGNGDFYYAVPSGHLALCSDNLSEPTIGPNSLTNSDDYFNTVLYTGNGYPTSDGQTISGVGFQPDWVWLKTRSLTHNHSVYDSSRGATKEISTNVATAEATEGSFLTAFNSDGFVLGSGNEVNQQNGTFVAWNWKANGGTTTTNDASATSVGTIDSVYQANTTAGFSIVTYTGTGSNATVAHGLGATPDMVIYKIRDAGTNWAVWHKDLATPTTGLLELSTNGVELNSASYWNSTIPTSTVLSIGTYGGVNASSPFIAYCFAGIDGYSEFGSYMGNGNVDGTFVFTGFRPAWVMLKNTDRSADWRINDSTRQHENNVGYSNAHLLLANSNSAEITNEYDIDFLSNGFKLRSSDVYENASGELFIYMAFAEAPFKYANAR